MKEKLPKIIKKMFINLKREEEVKLIFLKFFD
jgi:hypothetical protein